MKRRDGDKATVGAAPCQWWHSPWFWFLVVLVALFFILWGGSAAAA